MKIKRSRRDKSVSIIKTLLLLGTLILITLAISPVHAWGNTSYTNTNAPLYNTVVFNFEGVTNLSHDASTQGNKIALGRLYVPDESQVNFKLFYGNGSTVDGSCENHHINLLQTSSTIILNGVSDEYTYLDAQPNMDFYFTGYGKNSTDERDTGFLVYSMNYGEFDNGHAVFYRVPNIASNTIYRIDAWSSKPFKMEIDDGKPADVIGGVSKSSIDIIAEWVALAFSVGDMLYSLVVELIKWLKFFFIDNLTLTIALYVTLTMAFAARNARGNMEKFFRQFFNDQKKLVEFILFLWTTLIELIQKFRSIF